MKLPVTLALLSLSLVSVPSLPLSAQTAPAAAAEAVQVEVAGVDFKTPRGEGGTWLEASVELNVRPGGRAVSGQFVDRVRVTLNLGLEATDAKGEKTRKFYRSSAEAITLEGGKAVFRFYIPPEVVRRDRLRQDLHLVELEVGGQALQPTKANASSNITTAEILKIFQAKISSEAGANDGILMPQYLTPFAYDSQRPAPSFLRRESLR